MKTHYRFSILFIVLVFSTMTNAQKLKVIERPIVWDSTRIRLSLEYLEKRHGIKQTTPYIKPRMVVVHWTAIPTLEGSLRAFDKSQLSASRKELIQNSALNVSVAYLVDRDGTIYHLLPDTTFTRHCIGLNYMAIGIENIGDNDKYPLTDAQLKANVQIIKSLCKKYPIEWMIGHHEYYAFRNTPLWKETDPNYITQKTDPGPEFMEKLRIQLKKLNLKATP